MSHSPSPDRDDFTSTLARLLAKACRHPIPDPPAPTPEDLSAQRAEAWNRLAARLGIPVRLRHASLQTAAVTPAIAHVRDFLSCELRAGRCLVLCGPTGVGKSYAAAAALRHTHPPGSAFCYWPDLCADLLDPDTRRRALATARATGFLVFDDFGAEYCKDGGLLAASIDSIIWRRHADLLPTLLTTNLTPAQLADHFSDRVIDRLRDDWAAIHVITHPSLRRLPSPHHSTAHPA